MNARNLLSAVALAVALVLLYVGLNSSPRQPILIAMGGFLGLTHLVRLVVAVHRRRAAGGSRPDEGR